MHLCFPSGKMQDGQLEPHMEAVPVQVQCIVCDHKIRIRTPWVCGPVHFRTGPLHTSVGAGSTRECRTSRVRHSCAVLRARFSHQRCHGCAHSISKGEQHMARNKAGHTNTRKKEKGHPRRERHRRVVDGISNLQYCFATHVGLDPRRQKAPFAERPVMRVQKLLCT